MSRSNSTEDRISSLPDPIICDILSFLPTKLSASTSILSKRWKPLWLSVTTLHFDDKTFPNFISFRHFVLSVFPSRDISLPLRSFHLKCTKASDLHSHDINLFVQATARLEGMENLNLEISGMLFTKVKGPPSIFSCKTLVVLHLKGLIVNGLSQVVVDFPLLKALHLCYMHFEGLKHFINLLSGCSILEELQIKWTYVANDGKSLVLAESFQCLPNLVRANISNLLCSANVKMVLPCRAKILCVDLVTGYNHFSVFQNLIHMELILNYKFREMWKWVIEVLRRCPKLQNLTIHQDFENGKEVVDNWMDPTVAPECISTHLRTCLLKG